MRELKVTPHFLMLLGPSGDQPVLVHVTALPMTVPPMTVPRVNTHRLLRRDVLTDHVPDLSGRSAENRGFVTPGPQTGGMRGGRQGRGRGAAGLPRLLRKLSPLWRRQLQAGDCG